MQALTALRKYLMDNKSLNLDPADLKTFVENGIIYTVPGDSINGGVDANKDFQLQYDGLVFVDNVSLDSRYLCWLIGEWMNAHQPEHSAQDIIFEADILSHSEAVFEFRLKIKEDVKVIEKDEGTTLTSCFGKSDCPILGVMIADSPSPAPEPYNIGVIPNSDAHV